MSAEYDSLPYSSGTCLNHTVRAAWSSGYQERFWAEGGSRPGHGQGQARTEAEGVSVTFPTNPIVPHVVGPAILG